MIADNQAKINKYAWLLNENIFLSLKKLIIESINILLQYIKHEDSMCVCTYVRNLILKIKRVYENFETFRILLSLILFLLTDWQ